MTRGVAVHTAAFCVALSATAGAQPTANVGNTQTMEIVVTRFVVDARGERTGLPAQTIRYRLSRIRTERGWRTAMTLGAPNEASRQEVTRNRFFGGRVEVDEEGQINVFDQNGQELPVPAKLHARAMPVLNQDWSPSLEGISTSPQHRNARRDEVEAKYGTAKGTVRGLFRYVRTDADTVEELLFDAGRGVPRELNVVHGDRLAGRMVIDYDEWPGRGLVRRAVRSEVVINPEGDRAITTTEFSRVSKQVEKQP